MVIWTGKVSHLIVGIVHMVKELCSYVANMKITGQSGLSILFELYLYPD